MEGLWRFAKDFLNSFPDVVKQGNVSFCNEIIGTSLLEGITLKRFRAPSNTTEGAALRDFMNGIEEDEQMMEVLGASEEDFCDKTYYRHDFKIPHMSYFS